ncbi:MAG TPA: HD domain-containing phosphohydrolase [Candidatus Methanoperedens sp.]|nr:HD domain-containing phosphohydrolase [Candidatus Methanoperedens sp.]
MEQDRAYGFEIRLGDLVFAVSAALDLVSPVVADHHLRVARIARAVARALNLPPAAQGDLLLAAALHDVGAFSLRERLEIMRFEVQRPHEHAEAGYRLMKAFPHFERAAEIVRFHHLPWEHRRGEGFQGQPVPFGSHLLHLADRVSVLPLDWTRSSGLGREDLRMVTENAGSRFVPEFVEALLDAAASPGFPREIGAHGAGDLRDDPLIGAATLSESDFRGLARLFWQFVDYRSRFTATHTSGVAAVTAFLAPLAGVTGAAGRRVAIAAGLHDLGKLAVPSETLDKERPLNREERRSLRDHPLHGWRILGRIHGMEQINTWASYHHERLDGSGYPFHVAGSMIPRESRIVAVADIFTALTEERPYRRGLSPREAVGILKGMADDGAVDRDVVGMIAGNREQAATVRRQAQEGAASRYRAFLEHASPLLDAHSAA